MSNLDSILEYGLGGEKLLVPKAKQQIIDLFLALTDEAAKTHTMNKEFTTDYQDAFLNGIETMQISLGRKIKEL